MARSYTVTIRVVAEDHDDHPGDWDWATLIDSPYPVNVVDVVHNGCVPDDE